MTSCEHCDESVPHEHLDVPSIVRARRDSLVRSSAAAAAAWLLLAVAPLAAAAATGAAGAATTLGSTLLGMLAWGLATAVGLVAAGRARRRSARGPAASLATGALAAAAVTPPLALGVALVAGSAGAQPAVVALGAGAGWLTAALAAEVVGSLRHRSLLLAPGPDGEAARAGAVEWSRPHSGVGDSARRRGAGRDELERLPGAVVAGAAVGTWVTVLSVVPVLVVVLVPLHVGAVALLGRRRIRSRAARAHATLPG